MQQIPAHFETTQQILQQFVSEIRSAVEGRSADKSSMHRMKEALLAAAIYGEGNSSVEPDEVVDRVWSSFQEILGILLPPEIEFVRLVAQPPEIVIETKSTTFAIDAVSGGMRALLELAWQIHLQSFDSDQFTVCFDEPENHLHPSIQRTLIPNLVSAFPKVKFVIATHSPFIVTADANASVYALRHNSDSGSIDSVLLDFANKAQSAEQTLTSVLGVPSTSPVWAEQRFNLIMQKFAAETMSRDMLLRLRRALVEAGLEHELPFAIQQIIGDGDEKK